MERIRMTDVVSLLGLPQPPASRISYYVHCPCCDGERDQHLNINFKKEVFRCAKCGVSGGIFDLYALFTGTDRDRVWRELSERLRLNERVSLPKRRPLQQPVHDPLAGIDTRHKTYSVLLFMLGLANAHRENLHNRGLSDRDIVKLGYKSMPMANNSDLVRRMQEAGADPRGVPGFFRTKAGWWSFVHQRPGILIPVRDTHGMIQGLQLRLDNTENRKFRWISSVELTSGCGSPAWTHLAGKPSRMIVLTEGPMKADVIHALSGLTVLAAPGVNALQRLEESLTELRAKGVREIKTAFDMDYITNFYVQSAYDKLLALLGRMGFRYGTYVWDPRYKGLDDYIWAKLKADLDRKS